MSEDEIITNVKRIIEYKVISNYINNNDSRAIQGLLDLYQKEKEKNKDIANDLERYKKECYLQGRKDEEKSMLGVIQRHYISKDKIREKIKDKIKCCRAEELEDCYSGDKHSLYWRMFREILEKLERELLEENNSDKNK